MRLGPQTLKAKSLLKLTLEPGTSVDVFATIKDRQWEIDIEVEAERVFQLQMAELQAQRDAQQAAEVLYTLLCVIVSEVPRHSHTIIHAIKCSLLSLT